MRCKTPFVILLVAALCADADARADDKQFWGTLSGAALGGWLGSGIGKGSGRLAATGAGVFLGGALGNSIGQSLDRADAAYGLPRAYVPYAPVFSGYAPTYVAPPAPPPPRIVYVQPDIVEFRRVPTPVYVEEDFVGPPSGRRHDHGRHKRHCREFTQTIKIDGQTHESYGTACLRPDGSWQIVP